MQKQWSDALAEYIVQADSDESLGRLTSLVDNWSARDLLPRVTESLTSADPRERGFAATVLRDAIWRPDADLDAEIYGPVLLAALENEGEDGARHRIISAFQGAPYVAALPRLADLVSHPDADIRYSVAGALSSCGWESRSESAITSLCTLAGDPNADVRYSAVFELGSWWSEGCRSERIQAVLAAHVDDADAGVSAAAADALAT